MMQLINSHYDSLNLQYKLGLAGRLILWLITATGLYLESFHKKEIQNGDHVIINQEESDQV